MQIKRSGNHETGSKWPILFTIIGIVLIYYIFFHGEQGLIQYWKLLNKRDQISRHISELKQEQERLHQEIKLLENNYQYIEKIARERYKMGHKKDKIYVIIKE